MALVESRVELGVLASGSGTNLEAIAQAIADGDVPARMALVISDNPEAFALERAQRRGIPTRVIELKDFADRKSFDRAIIDALREAGVDLVVLAGFMKLIGPEMVDAFPDQIMNIHPALLPSFPGEHGVPDALEHGVKVTGVTVHFVDKGLDSGP
ncbi:MAG: phosphoribosylglycinamide formyltransferase, partial [Candidatus Geothermincolia bacterium]